jgi:hypothetical protein
MGDTQEKAVFFIDFYANQALIGEAEELGSYYTKRLL